MEMQTLVNGGEERKCPFQSGTNLNGIVHCMTFIFRNINSYSHDFRFEHANAEIVRIISNS